MSLPEFHSRLPKRSLLFIAVGLFFLSFLSAWYFKVQPSIKHQQKLLQKYIDKQLTDADALVHDSVLMRKLVLKTETLPEFESIRSKGYGLFLFAEEISDNQDIIFWNNQKILPPTVDFNAEDGYFFHRLANGSYVVNKTTLHFSGLSNNIVAYVMVPVLNQFYVPTDYLVTSFVHDEDAINKISITNDTAKYPITALNGRPLFGIKEVSHSNVTTTDLLTVVLRITALIFLFIYASLLAESIVTRSRALYGVIFLSVTFILFRLLMFRSE
ncbi:MAG TPA: hypothetical protein VI385_13800, partial [Flavisolibacter sp.]